MFEFSCVNRDRFIFFEGILEVEVFAVKDAYDINDAHDVKYSKVIRAEKLVVTGKYLYVKRPPHPLLSLHESQVLSVTLYNRTKVRYVYAQSSLPFGRTLSCQL